MPRSVINVDVCLMPLKETTLKLHYDNAVIGGGLSGLVAAMRLSGSTILLSKGLGSSAISSGVIVPSGAIDHDAERWFIDIMKDSACPYVRGIAKTDLGSYREGIVQSITSFEGEPQLVSLDSACFNGRSCQEMAKLVETSERALDGLIGSLSSIKTDSVMIPPILGISTVNDRRAYLEKAAGVKAYEYVTAPSVHGYRLITALKEKAGMKKGLTLMDMVTVERLRDGILYGYMGTKGKRAIQVGANRVIIATGGILTGFKLEDGRAYEPLTGREVSGSVDGDVNISFFTDHPLMYKGIGPGPFKVSGFNDVRAIGAVSDGYGLYRSLVAGYNAEGAL